MTPPDDAGQPAANDPVRALVGEFMEEKRREQADDTSSSRTRRRNPGALAILVLVCAAVWVAPSLMLPPAPEPTAEELERGARLSLFLTALEIRQYQDSAQRLPASLAELGTSERGIEYSAADSVYELSTRVAGTLLVYRSTLPDSVFLGNLRIRGIS